MRTKEKSMVFFFCRWCEWRPHWLVMCVANFPILNPVELDAVGFDHSKLNQIVLGIVLEGVKESK